MSEPAETRPRFGSILDVFLLGAVVVPAASRVLREEQAYGAIVRIIAALGIAAALGFLALNFVRFWAEPERWAGRWSIGPYAVLGALLTLAAWPALASRPGPDVPAAVVLLACGVQLLALAIRDVARVRRRRVATS